MRLLERNHPVDVLRDRARRAAAGRGSVVLLAGEAGIGKTVLLREFAAQAPVPVLWGMCDPLSTPRPLGPLRDVAHELGPEVTAVLREASAQHEIFAAVLDALQCRSCALVVEDLHWGDEATLDLVRFLDVPTATVEGLGATGLLDRRGRGVAFRHEIARSAVLGAVALGAEPALHARMIEALEAVGGDASVLAHHAAAAADVPRIVRYAPAAASDAARSGAHREAVAFYELALRHLGQDDPGRRAGVLELLSEELYLTDRLDGAIAARTQALELRRGLGDVVAVGAGHRALSLFTWYAADRWTAQRQDDAAISVLSEAGEPHAFGYALANRAYLAASWGDLAKGL